MNNLNEKYSKVAKISTIFKKLTRNLSKKCRTATKAQYVIQQSLVVKPLQNLGYLEPYMRRYTTFLETKIDKADRISSIFKFLSRKKPMEKLSDRNQNLVCDKIVGIFSHRWCTNHKNLSNRWEIMSFQQWKFSTRKWNGKICLWTSQC